jgi:hypothetical protein
MGELFPNGLKLGSNVLPEQTADYFWQWGQ